MVEITDLIGKIVVEILSDSDTLQFNCSDGTKYMLYHDQDCCEKVYIDDIVGDLEDLIGNPIRLAEEVINNQDDFGRVNDDSFTWTFYKFATIKGYVDIKWYGSSKGYYSERVSFKQI
jgi:hypothetical protein